jgi:predicted nuclease of predicted toxin-antitoxin system
VRLIFDECIPRPLKLRLPGHEITTVQQQGWSGVVNGALLTRIGAASFDAFITMDKSMPAQQRLAGRPFSVILLRAVSNRLDVLAPLAPLILSALAEAKSGQVVTISAT